MLQRSTYRCHVHSSLGFCLSISLIVGATVSLFLLPDLPAVSSQSTTVSEFRIAGFILLFVLTYLMTRFGYGYRVRIHSGDDSESSTLWVRSTSKSSATAIPLPAIDRVEAMEYRDRPDDLYAIPQYAHTGEGVIVHYTLGARYGDAGQDQRRIWFPVCDRETFMAQLKTVVADS
ncbi:MAG: hypothetical protein ABW101_00155 [Candidatus Thiodiazotropha sp.]